VLEKSSVLAGVSDGPLSFPTMIYKVEGEEGGVR
jgi:hypothetical protein